MKKITLLLVTMSTVLLMATSGFAYTVGTLNSFTVPLLTQGRTFSFTDTTAAKSTPGELLLSFDYSGGGIGSSNLSPAILLVNGVTGAPYTGVLSQSRFVTPPFVFSGHAPSTFAVDYNSQGVYSFMLYGYTSVTNPNMPPITLTGIKLTKSDPPTATPLPAAVWLLGSGLMGLVGMRKKFKA